MTKLQRTIKYLAMAFAIFLIVSIFSGILSVARLLVGLGNKNLPEELTTYPVTEEVTSLDLEINAAELVIKTADNFSVESNIKNLSVTQNGGVLLIKEPKNFGVTYKGAVLTICLPENTVFKKADVEAGAGVFTAETLSAEKLYLNLGAGEVQISSLSASKEAVIEGGAGKLTVSGGRLNNADIEMGVGALYLTSELTGESEIDCGVGNVETYLLGEKENYRIELNKGIGKATVDNETVADETVYGNGKNEIEINGGIGEIKVNFK